MSSVAASLWKGDATHQGISGFLGAKNTVGTVLFGAIAGGAGADFTGGNFWQGAVTGGIVAYFNHALHDGGDGTDPPTKKKNTTTSNTNKSDLKSGSAVIGYEGMIVDKTEIFIKSSAKGSSFADRRHIYKTLKLTSKVGKGLGFVGIGLTGLEDYNAGGLTWGTAAKVGIGGALLFASAPVSLTYAAIDIGWGLATGTTITDNIGNYVNQKTK